MALASARRSCWTPGHRTVYRLSGLVFCTLSMNSDRFSASPFAAGGDVVVPVSALNRAIASMLERSFPLAWISGEVSNFTRAASGHWYFSIKDAQAQIRCVMFRGRAQYACG
jgi:exodeoxyribonuclease VII large subunit